MSSSSFKEGLRELGLYMEDSESDKKNKKTASTAQNPNEENKLSPINQNDDYNISDVIYSASQSEPNNLTQKENPIELFDDDQIIKEININEETHKENNNIEIKNKSEKKNKQSKNKKNVKKKNNNSTRIDFNAIFEGFNDEEKPLSSKPIETFNSDKLNQKTSSVNSTIHNSNLTHDKPDAISLNIETRIIDYFNNSVNSMISSFLSELELYFKQIDNTDHIIQSFASDIKRSVRQSISFKDSYDMQQQSDFVEPYLISYKNVFEDIQNDISDPSLSKFNDIKEYRKLFKDKNEKINSNMRVSIVQLKQELTEMNSLQKSAFSKEKTLNNRISQVRRKITDLECKEILQKGESQLNLVKQERYDDMFNRIDQNFNAKNDVDRIFESFQDFVLAFRSRHVNPEFQNNAKESMKRMNYSVEEFEESCQLYHLKLNQSLNIMNLAQNQRNESILSLSRQMQNRMSKTQLPDETSKTQLPNPNKISKIPKKDANSNNHKSKMGNSNRTQIISSKRKTKDLDTEITYMEDLRHRGNHKHHSIRERK